MNVFFVHTPLQLLIAQNIVIQERLENPLLLLAHNNERSKHFYKSYDILIVPELWKDVYEVGAISVFSHLCSRPVNTFLELRRLLTKVDDIIKRFASPNLFFGDINHFFYILVAEKYKSVASEVNFFEEGVSHYAYTIDKKKFAWTPVILLKKVFVDTLIFRPLGIPPLSKYFYSTKDCSFGFNIKKKYSVFQMKSNSYDWPLEFRIPESSKLKDLLHSQLQSLVGIGDKKLLLFLSTSSTFLFENPEQDEYDALDGFFKDYHGQEVVVLLKFHPSDAPEKKDCLQRYFTSRKFIFKELLTDLPIPVEVFIGKIEIAALIGYNSSAMLYAQSINPELRVVSLLPYVCNAYKSNGIINDRIPRLWRDFQRLQMQLLGRPLSM
jgi:hypothetical protein